jgi:hypothetical protein
VKTPEFSDYNNAVSSAEVICGRETNIGREGRCSGNWIKSKLAGEL